ncbi:MAG: DUF2262 domain-containing protein [Lachnospiraceae bacterium]|nr:DUF2262 domain-containing protein [Lachnospiraceae bacterium]
MSKEREKFAQRFDAVEKEVLVLTESGMSASRWGKNKLWGASVTILAMVDLATKELIEEKCTLEWQLTEQECESPQKLFALQREAIYRLRVQESLPFMNEYIGKEMKRGNSLWVKEVLERDCKEERLQAILEEFRKPVTVMPEGCKELLLDKSLGIFCGEGSWNGEECQVNLEVDEEGAQTATDALATLKRLMEECKSWDDKARKYAAVELTQNANDWAMEDDENAEEITEEEFAKRLMISELCVSVKGDFEIYYEDDDIFWGHVVIVSGNIETGIDDAYMAG